MKAYLMTLLLVAFPIQGEEKNGEKSVPVKSGQVLQLPEVQVLIPCRKEECYPSVITSATSKATVPHM